VSKLLKSHAVSLPEIKNQQGRNFDETCRIRIRLCKKAKKETLMMRKVATSRKYKTHNRQRKTRHISVC